MKILLVEDHPLTAQSIRYYFEGKHSVTHAATCMDAEDYLQKNRYDAIILDLGLPDGSGSDLCSSLSDQENGPAILVISGKSDTFTKVRTLELGADDYITKPFTSPELYARVQAVTRRTQRTQASSELFTFANLTLTGNMFSYQKKSISLTKTETAIFKLFLKHCNHTISKEHLIQEIFRGRGREGERSNSLEAHIKNIRQKIRKISANHSIITIYSFGYRLITKEI